MDFKRIVHFIFIHIPYSDFHKQILQPKIWNGWFDSMAQNGLSQCSQGDLFK